MPRAVHIDFFGQNRIAFRLVNRRISGTVDNRRIFFRLHKGLYRRGIGNIQLLTVNIFGVATENEFQLIAELSVGSDD